MKAWETFKEYFMITVGVAIVAVSVYFLLVPSHVTVGSTAVCRSSWNILFLCRSQ